MVGWSSSGLEQERGSGEGDGSGGEQGSLSLPSVDPGRLTPSMSLPFPGPAEGGVPPDLSIDLTSSQAHSLMGAGASVSWPRLCRNSTHLRGDELSADDLSLFWAGRWQELVELDRAGPQPWLAPSPGSGAIDPDTGEEYPWPGEGERGATQVLDALDWPSGAQRWWAARDAAFRLRVAPHPERPGAFMLLDGAGRLLEFGLSAAARTRAADGSARCWELERVRSTGRGDIRWRWLERSPGQAPVLVRIEDGAGGGRVLVWRFRSEEIPALFIEDGGSVAMLDRRISEIERGVISSDGDEYPTRWVHSYEYDQGRLTAIDDRAGELPVRRLLSFDWQSLPIGQDVYEADEDWWVDQLERLPTTGDGSILWVNLPGVEGLQALAHHSDGGLSMGQAFRRSTSSGGPAFTRWLERSARGGLHMLSGTAGSWQLERLSDGHLATIQAPLSLEPADPSLEIVDLHGRGLPDLWRLLPGGGALVAESLAEGSCVDFDAGCQPQWLPAQEWVGPRGASSAAEGSWVSMLAGGPLWWVELERRGDALIGARAWAPGGSPGSWHEPLRWRWEAFSCEPGSELLQSAGATAPAQLLCRDGANLRSKALIIEPGPLAVAVDQVKEESLPPGLPLRALRSHGAAGTRLVGWSDSLDRWIAHPISELEGDIVLREVSAFDGRRATFEWTRTRSEVPRTALPFESSASPLLPWPVVREVVYHAEGPWASSLQQRWTPGALLAPESLGFAHSLAAEVDLDDADAPARHTLHRFAESACAHTRVESVGVIRGGAGGGMVFGELHQNEIVWLRGDRVLANAEGADRCTNARTLSRTGPAADAAVFGSFDEPLPPGVVEERSSWLSPTQLGCQLTSWREEADGELISSRRRCYSWTGGGAHADWLQGWVEHDSAGELRAALRLTPDMAAAGGGIGRGVVAREERWSVEQDKWIVTSERTHSMDGQLLEERDALGRRTLWTWDRELPEKPSSQTQLPPEGEVAPEDTDRLETLWEWDASTGQLLAQRDPNERWGSRTFDERGRELAAGFGRAPSQLDQTQRYVDAEPGVQPALLETTTHAAPSPSMQLVTWHNSTGGTLARVLAGVIVQEYKRFNAWGEVALSCAPWELDSPSEQLPEPLDRRNCERIERDAFGRAVEVTSQTARRRLRYSPTDRSEEVYSLASDQPLRGIRTRTDALGRVLELVEGTPGGSIRRWRRTYSPSDGSMRLIFPSGEERTWRQDSLGRVVETSDPAAGLTIFHFADDGSQIATENELGELMGTSFDSLGRPSRAWETIDGVERETARMRWDRGELVERVTEDLTRRWRFDERGRNISEEVSAPEGSWLSQTRWDDAGRPIEHIYADGSRQQLTWDDTGRLIAMPGVFSSIQSHANGTYTSLVSAAGWREELSLDERGRPALWQVTGAPARGGAERVSLQLRFTPMDEPLQRRIEATSSASPAESRWSYDEWGRLAEWSSDDHRGDLLAELSPLMDEDDQWYADALDAELACESSSVAWLPSSCGDQSLSWDGAGRLVELGEWSFEWGVHGLPRRMSDASGNERRWSLAPDGSVEREVVRGRSGEEVRIYLSPSQVVEVRRGRAQLRKLLRVGGVVRLEITSELAEGSGWPSSGGRAGWLLLFIPALFFRHKQIRRLAFAAVIVASCGAPPPSVTGLIDSGDARWWFHDPVGDLAWWADGRGALQGPQMLDPMGRAIGGGGGADRPEWQGLEPVSGGMFWRAATRLWIPAIGRWASPDSLVMGDPSSAWRDANPYARVGGRWDVWTDPSGRSGEAQFNRRPFSSAPEQYGRRLAEAIGRSDNTLPWVPEGATSMAVGTAKSLISVPVQVTRSAVALAFGGAAVDAVGVAGSISKYRATAEAEALQLIVIGLGHLDSFGAVDPPHFFWSRATQHWSEAAQATIERVEVWESSRDGGADRFRGMFSRARRAAGDELIQAFMADARTWSREEIQRFAFAYAEARYQAALTRTLNGTTMEAFEDPNDPLSRVGNWAGSLFDALESGGRRPRY